MIQFEGQASEDKDEESARLLREENITSDDEVFDEINDKRHQITLMQYENYSTREAGRT